MYRKLKPSWSHYHWPHFQIILRDLTFPMLITHLPATVTFLRVSKTRRIWVMWYVPSAWDEKIEVAHENIFQLLQFVTKHNVMCSELSYHYYYVIVRLLMTSNDIMMSISCDILNTKQGHSPLISGPMTSPCLFSRPMIQDIILTTKSLINTNMFLSWRLVVRVNCGHSDAATINLVLSFLFFQKYHRNIF